MCLDRGGCERFGLDPDEDVRAEVSADHRLELDKRHRRNLVDESRELLDNVGHQSGPDESSWPS